MAGLRPPEHPLFTIQRIENLRLGHAAFPERMTYDFYTIGLKKNLTGYITYGRTNYDFQEGALGFAAPDQLMEFKKDVLKGATGWLLFFHKDLCNASMLQDRLEDYGFFGYDTNEGLHLSKNEEDSLEVIFVNIEKEYKRAIDTFSKQVVLSNLELLLTYAHRYYARQFVVRNEVDATISSNFKKELRSLFRKGNITNLPTVESLASRLNLSANYLSDSLKATTGKSALEHIHSCLIDKAKNDLLVTDKTISEIAFELGFEYPHYFSRLFKKKTGVTPSEFRTISK